MQAINCQCKSGKSAQEVGFVISFFFTWPDAMFQTASWRSHGNEMHRSRNMRPAPHRLLTYRHIAATPAGGAIRFWLDPNAQ